MCKRGFHLCIVSSFSCLALVCNEWWERRARVLREGSKYLESLDTCGLFTSRCEDGVGVLALPVSLT